MRKGKLLIAAIAVVAALGASIAAHAGNGDKVTGGGQTDVGTQGAGDTIAFTAQSDPTGAVKGQVQYIDRTGGTGQGQVVYHGTVTCLNVEDNVADFSGVWDNDAGEFEIVVEDNGQGSGSPDDAIGVMPAASNPDCGDDNDNDANASLSRGNAQVTDAG